MGQIVSSLIPMEYGAVADPEAVNHNFEKLRQAVNANTQDTVVVNENLTNINTAEGAFSAQLTFVSNLTTRARVRTQRLSDVLSNRLFQSRIDRRGTLHQYAVSSGETPCAGARSM